MYDMPTARADKTEPFLEIVIVTFERVNQLMCLLWSLESQTTKDFKVRVIHDGSNPEAEQAVTQFSTKSSFKIRYDESTRRFNDYGHSLRQWGLQESLSAYLLLTNDDNYYTPNFIEEMIGSAKENNADIVYCDMVHSHVIKDLPNPIGYQTLITSENSCRIDIGCFIFKATLGQNVGFRSRGFAADWTFFEDMLSLQPRVVKLPKVLFVHN
jgi:hypothetical protein